MTSRSLPSLQTPRLSLQGQMRSRSRALLSTTQLGVFNSLRALSVRVLLTRPGGPIPKGDPPGEVTGMPVWF